MKKIIPFLIFTVLFYSCEKANINLVETNIETRLQSMVGQKIGAVSNTLKSEGFQKLKIEQQTNFIKNNEIYLLKDIDKTIVLAGYQLKDSTKSVNLYEEYRNSFLTKNTDGYQGYIYAEHFADFSKGYVDSIKVNNNEYMYIYDDPFKFYFVLKTNMFYLKTASETWYNGKINKDKMWNLQLGEKAKIVAITYSDFSLAQ